MDFEPYDNGFSPDKPDNDPNRHQDDISRENLYDDRSAEVYENPNGNFYYSEQPNYTNQVPNYTNQVPNYTNQVPNYTNQVPNYTNQAPNYTNQVPNYTNQVPNYTNQVPNYGAQPPFLPEGKKQPRYVPYEVWLGEKKKIRDIGMMAGCAILAYILLSSVFSYLMRGIFSLLDSMEIVNYSMLYDSAFTNLYSALYSVFIVGGPFFIVGLLLRKKGYIGTIPFTKPKNPKYLPFIVLGGFGICLLGDIFTGYFDSFIEAVTGFEVNMPETPTPEMNFLEIFLMFFSTAVVPALVEEYIMRGVVMHSLRRYGDWFAIIASSLIFGLMHCNLLQIPFAFIAGIALGYAVIKTGSIWTGVLIHFLNNAFSVALTLVYDFCGTESVAAGVCDIVFYVMLAIGVACTLFYVLKLDREKLQQTPLVNCGKKFFGYLHPTSAKVKTSDLYKAYILNLPMIAAFIAVAFETVATLILLS